METFRVQVAFRYGDPRLFSRLVCLWRGGDSAHCEVSVFRDAEAGEQVLHHCYSASFLDKGVRFKVMPLPESKWRIYEMPWLTTDAHEWYRTHAHSGYDILGLLGFVLRRIEGRESKWFCSEACAAMLGMPKPFLFDLVTLEAVCKWTGKRIQ